MADFPTCLLTPGRLQPHLPLFVFLPGMDGTGQLLRLQTEGLQAGFDVRCLALSPTCLPSWEELAAETIELIEQELQQWGDRPVYLCGESFGGCLALKIALALPRCLTRLILINPASSFRHRQWLGWSSLVTSWLPSPLYRLSSVALLPWLAALERMATHDRQALLHAVQSVPQKTSIWRLSLLNDFAIEAAQLCQITLPTLLIAGDMDRLLPSVAEVQRLAQALPQAQVTYLPGSGHACLLEQGVNLYDILQQQQFTPTSLSLEDAIAPR